MQIHEVRALSQEDIYKELEESYKEALGIRTRVATRQLNDTSQLKKIHKKIARIKTVIKEREILEQQE